MKNLFLLALSASAMLQGSLIAQNDDDNKMNAIGVNENPITKNERTLAIIKPDAVKNKHIGEIISRFEQAGLRIVAIKMVKLDREQASQFYKVHRDRPFFQDLINLMSSAPVVVLVIEGQNAVSRSRELMGATDPNKAARGTIRADFAESITRNAIHGSDSLESAREEIPFFFTDLPQ